MEVALSKEPPPEVLSNEEQPKSEDNMEENIPPELSKTYHFGCCPWHPQWLQWLFARKKFFTFLLCCYAFLQGAIVVGEWLYAYWGFSVAVHTYH